MVYPFIQWHLILANLLYYKDLRWINNVFLKLSSNNESL